MNQSESKIIASAAIRLALTADREAEKELKAELSREGIRATAVDYGGEFISSVQKVVERDIHRPRPPCYLGLSSPVRGSSYNLARSKEESPKRSLILSTVFVRRLSFSQSSIKKLS